MHRRTALALVVFALLTVDSPVYAQGSRRFAVDTVTGVQDIYRETRDWPTQAVFDTFASAELRPGLQLSVRPKLWRVNGDWELLLDQASVEYQFVQGSRWRIEAGRFPSPMGLGMTENRPNVNAGLVWWHRPYYMPLPSLGPDQPRVSLVSAVYPTGVLVSTSGDHWDARGALLDRSPVGFWYGDDRSARSANIVAGAGVTPKQGLRVGLAMASGEIAERTATLPATRYDMLNVEADYAVAYTRVSGEWTHDRFETPTGDRVARGWTAQVQQTIGPRWFAHARVTSIRAPEVTSAGVSHLRFRSVDATVGYRLDAELTARVGYSAIRSFTASATDHQVGLSLMWARRWW